MQGPQLSAADPPVHPEPKDPDSAPSQASPETSAAFATSGFGKLASSQSGFAALASPQASGFASAKPTLSSFSSAKPTPSSGTQPTKGQTTAPASVAHPPRLSFAVNPGLSPFAGLLNTNGSGGTSFGSGSVLSSTKPLVACGTKPLHNDKATRPFGAPESDASEDDRDDDEGENVSQPDETGRGVSPEKDMDDRKKLKLQKGEQTVPSRNSGSSRAQLREKQKQKKKKI